VRGRWRDRKYVRQCVWKRENVRQQERERKQKTGAVNEEGMEQKERERARERI